MSKTKLSAVLYATALCLTAPPALAYVGPGAGLTLLAALWGLLVAVLVAVGFVVLWPIRRWRRRRRAAQQAQAQGEDHVDAEILTEVVDEAGPEIEAAEQTEPRRASSTASRGRG